MRCVNLAGQAQGLTPLFCGAARRAMDGVACSNHHSPRRPRSSRHVNTTARVDRVDNPRSPQKR